MWSFVNIVLEQFCDIDDGWQIQAMYLKFCMKLSKSVTDRYKMFHQDLANIGQMQVFEWYTCFKASQVSIHDDHLRWPIISKIPEKNRKKFIDENCSWKSHQLSHMIGINYGVCQEKFPLPPHSNPDYMKNTNSGTKLNFIAHIV